MARRACSGLLLVVVHGMLLGWARDVFIAVERSKSRHRRLEYKLGELATFGHPGVLAANVLKHEP